jgi:sRNA-binding protein
MADEHADAAKKHAEETKKRLGEERAAREKASKEGAKAAGDVKPTPTQEEADMAASGVYLSEHEDDGSGPDPNVAQTKDTKQAEAGKPKSGYATRASTAG